MQKNDLTADTPLSALFREEHHEVLNAIIDGWRSALIDSPECDALKMTSFMFDFDWLRPIDVYLDLVSLIINDGLRTPMSVLARYIYSHSNLSKSEASLYGLLKRYKRMSE